MKIGNFEIQQGAILAPMAGVTDVVFRGICKGYNASLTYTEMVSAAGLFYQPKKSMDLMIATDSENPKAVQIFGSEPERMGYIAQKYCMDFDIIDINMGCPAPKIVKGGAGSALMREPDRAADIIKAVIDRTGKTVTCKIRSGWDEEDINAVSFAQAMQKAGANAVCLHARTRNQLYSGAADWSLIARLKSEIDIPVIGNGDIKSPEDAKRMLDETKCDGIMVARAAQGKPYIFEQIKKYLETGVLTEKPGIKQIMKDTVNHAEKLSEIYGEKNAVLMMRKHLIWYIKGEKDASALRNKAASVKTLKDIKEFAKQAIEE